MSTKRQRLASRLATAVVSVAFILSATPISAATFAASYTTTSDPATSLTLQKPSGTGVGDLMIAAVTYAGAYCQRIDDDSQEDCVTVTTPDGWTLINGTSDNGTISMVTYYRVAEYDGDFSFTWTFSEEVPSIGGVVAYEGTYLSDPIDDFEEGDAFMSLTSATLTAPSVTTTGDDETVVSFYADNSTDTISSDGDEALFAVSRSAFFASRHLSSAAFEDVKEDAGETEPREATTSGAHHWVAQTIALRNAPTCEEDQKCEEPTHRGGGSSHAPTVQVVAPNGGETFLHGTQTNIFWSATADQMQLVRVSLSTDGGATYPTLVTEQGMNMGFHDWTVPDVNTTEARIRVQAIGAGDVVLAQDASNENFTIEGTPVPPQPEVLGETDTTLPDGVTAESFIKLPSDGNPETQADSTVYWVGADNLAHAFVSQPSYMTWYASFEGVQVVDEATLAALTQGETIGVRPGTSWIKTVGDDKVYYVAPGNVLRWISSESVALMLAGADWHDNVMDMDASLLAGYAYGEDLTVESLGTVWPNGLVRSGDDTWLVIGGERRRFASAEAFAANRYQERHVQADGSSSWTSLPIGSEITGLEAGLTDLMQ